jgi:hypothetical protein
MPFPTRFVLMAAMISLRTAMEKKDYLNNRETVNHTLVFFCYFSSTQFVIPGGLVNRAPTTIVAGL